MPQQETQQKAAANAVRSAAENLNAALQNAARQGLLTQVNPSVKDIPGTNPPVKTTFVAVGVMKPV